MNPPRGPMVNIAQGETVKLGAPFLSELVIKVDPRQVGSLFSMGLQTISPGGAIPVHRHLTQDEVLFVHKGQGRATLEGRAMTVVPGMMMLVPRQAWHGLRNNGTGALEITWTAAPPGIEEFFRELSRLNSPLDAATTQQIAQRHGVEFRPEAEPAAAGAGGAAPARRHRHRGRRGGRGHRRPAPSSPAAPPTTAARQSSPASTSSTPTRPAATSSTPTRPASTSSTPTLPAPPPPAQPRRAPPRGRFRRQRVREVYMGGRWVRVEGEGPIIAPGKERSSRGRKDTPGEGGPRGPLSVSL